MKNEQLRSDILEGAPMRLAPENEMGVVFLFAHLARRWRLKIEEIQAPYPDCIAYMKTHGKEKRIRIEFKFKSRNFRTQGHDPKKCDWLVCWEHNWPDAPKRLNIVELRREFGLGFNIWLMSVKNEYQKELDHYPSGDWSAPGQAHKGDLILFYFSGHHNKSINYIYKCKERAFFEKHVSWKKGSDCRAHIQRVCKLKAPVFLEDLQGHRVLRTAGFVRGDLQGRRNVTEYWPYLFEMITKRNPALRQKLAKYSPESLA